MPPLRPFRPGPHRPRRRRAPILRAALIAFAGGLIGLLVLAAGGTAAPPGCSGFVPAASAASAGAASHARVAPPVPRRPAPTVSSRPAAPPATGDRPPVPPVPRDRPGATAHPPGVDLRREAWRLLALDHRAFAAAAARPDRRPELDWSSDGCSRTPAEWARRFRAACRLHDFGYRNVGRGLRLESDEAARAAIDDRFRDEMRGICDRGRAHASAWRRCRAQAALMHLAVRRLNRW